VAIALALITIISVPACIAPDEVEVGSTASALVGPNGSDLNGSDLNGSDLNGSDLNGPTLPGAVTIWTSLDGVTIGGTTLDAATLDASLFNGSAGATTYSGADFVGAQFQAMRGDGSMATLRIASIAGQTPFRWSYFVEYLESDSQWYPICENTNGPLAAYALPGTWNYQTGVANGGAHSNDPTKFTFACRTRGALAKCIDDGYVPWLSHNGTSLVDHHQTCVRMLRADYCGNGTSYTTNGRLVNLYDGIGVQVDTETFRLEAEWAPEGARCLTDARRASVAVPCFPSAPDPACGDVAHFNSGTLIMNEIP
jgi:hypothetical protein